MNSSEEITEIFHRTPDLTHEQPPALPEEHPLHGQLSYTYTSYHPQLIVYIMVYFWCCTSYGFGLLYNDMSPSLQYLTAYIYGFKILICSAEFSFLFL